MAIPRGDFPRWLLCGSIINHTVAGPWVAQRLWGSKAWLRETLPQLHKGVEEGWPGYGGSQHTLTGVGGKSETVRVFIMNERGSSKLGHGD